MTTLSETDLTVPAEFGDFSEWHRGRKEYSVWMLACNNHVEINRRFNAAQSHLRPFLLDHYDRQAHITIAICGFPTLSPQHDDDFSREQFEIQKKRLSAAEIRPFKIIIGGLDSFKSVPILQVSDPEGGIKQLRSILIRQDIEFRSCPYLPHITVGLYTDNFPGYDILPRLRSFNAEPIVWQVNEIVLASYEPEVIGGPLFIKETIPFRR